MPVNVACVVLDDDEKNIEIIFLQSKKQRDWFDKFPELIILDGTYKINNAGIVVSMFTHAHYQT